jgi:prenyltransferase beta subunit
MKKQVGDWFQRCNTANQEPTGAFGAHPNHDAHILPTCSAVQILLMQGAEDRIDVDRVTDCTATLISSYSPP